MLKDRLEPVMVAGVGFRFDERDPGRVRPDSTGSATWSASPRTGSSRAYVRLVNDNGTPTITRALRSSCGCGPGRMVGLYGVDGSTVDDRGDAFAARVDGDGGVAMTVRRS